MDDEIDLPPGIGPHNDRELELMLAGTKPMAMFSDAVHVSAYFPRRRFRPARQSRPDHPRPGNHSPPTL